MSASLTDHHRIEPINIANFSGELNCFNVLSLSLSLSLSFTLIFLLPGEIDQDEVISDAALHAELPAGHLQRGGGGFFHQTEGQWRFR